MLSGLSRSIEKADPDRALLLNPFNANARVHSLVGAMNGQAAGTPAPGLEASVRRGLLTDPIDARFHSVLAEIRMREGNRQEAYRLFEQALQLSRTELHALKHLVARAIEAREYAQAVQHLDLLLRRWPGHGDEVYPVLPALIADEVGYKAFVAVLADGPPWRMQALRALAGNEAGLGHAYRLLLDLAATPQPPVRNEIAVVLRGFTDAKRYEEAYRLFRFALPEGERRLSGFVHNAGFAPEGEAYPFSWNRRNTRGAEISFSEDPSRPGAMVRFLNAPAKNISLWQHLVLPAGRYRLTVDAEILNLKAPRSLYWQVYCMEPRREITRIQVPEGNHPHRTMTAEFDIEACASQRLVLRTDVIAESWQNRYSGLVYFRSVKIERIDLGQAED